MKIKKIKSLFALLGLMFIVGSFHLANAETNNNITNENNGILFENIGSDIKQDGANNITVPCTETGNCKVSDMVIVAINITKFMSALIGSVALLFFIIAGIKMLTSAGNPQAIASAKQMMTQTIIGILVFLSAYVIVNFVQQTLLNTSDSGYQYKLNSDYNPKKIIK